jgi:hypothetical protein
MGLSQWRDAQDDYLAAAKFSSDGTAAARTAWLLATCPDEAFYRPDTALDLARYAIEQYGQSAAILEALAAAHAAKGDFELAVKSQQAALAFDGDKSARQQRLELYQAGQPVVLPAQRIDSGQMRTSTLTVEPEPQDK